MKIKAKRGEVLDFTQLLVENSGYVILSNTENRVLIVTEITLNQLNPNIELLGVRVGDWPKQAWPSNKIVLACYNGENSQNFGFFTTNHKEVKDLISYPINYKNAWGIITSNTKEAIINEIQQAQNLPTEIPIEVYIP